MNSDLQTLRAEYHRLEGLAATEQMRFSRSANPDWLSLLDAGRKAQEARRAFLKAQREQQ